MNSGTTKTNGNKLSYVDVLRMTRGKWGKPNDTERERAEKQEQAEIKAAKSGKLTEID